MSLKYKALAVIICLLSISCSLFAALNQESYRIHTISRGETVYSISRSYNVLVSEIFNLNPQVEKGLKSGETLKIPAAHPQANNNGQEYIWHSIEAKETLYSVSKHYHVTIDDILAANAGLTADNFRIGQVVRIPKVQGVAIRVAERVSPVSSYVIHKVQSKETLYSISRQYNISITQLVALNPDVNEKGLVKDMELRIPAETNLQPSYTVVETELSPKPSGPFYPMMPKELAGPVGVGLLLPFLEIQEHQQTRFVEYYEGFLLAVEEMKSEGHSIELYVFDIQKGEGVAKLKSLLETHEMKNLDFIIGGVSDEEVVLLSEFTKENNIGYAIPFPLKNTQAVKNPLAFLSNVSSSYLYPKAAENFVEQFVDGNIVILEDENSNNNDKKEFIALVKNNMEKQSMLHKTVSVNTRLVQNLRSALLSSGKNVIVPASSSLISLSKIIPAIRTIRLQNPSLNISLFGYPDWQTYSAQFLEDFFNSDTYIFSSFYVDNLRPETQQFKDKYRHWYGKTMLNTYPKYGILGYDTGLYFLTALTQDREFYNDNAVNIKVPTIQSVFSFDKINDEGYVNTGLYFVHYRTDMTIEKKDYSK